MFGVGTQEILVILTVVLLLFGGKRIPEIARSLGKGLGDFRRAVNDVQREVDLEILKETTKSDNARRLPERSGSAANSDRSQEGPPRSAAKSAAPDGTSAESRPHDG